MMTAESMLSKRLKQAVFSTIILRSLQIAEYDRFHKSDFRPTKVSHLKFKARLT